MRETPPRMRGRLLKLLTSARTVGNTPAYAGKTSSTATTATRSGKHPRVCGEDLSPVSMLRLSTETPPRMRGRLMHRAGVGVPEGNTPAYAGKTKWQRVRHRQPWKHPRVCGEDRTHGESVRFSRETPPRMRGRLLKGGLSKLGAGNTPAYAGKTVSMT